MEIDYDKYKFDPNATKPEIHLDLEKYKWEGKIRTGEPILEQKPSHRK